MNRVIAGACTLLLVASASAAQEPASSGTSSDARSPFSVQTGVGFFVDDNFDGFLWSTDGTYRFTDNWSAGIELQVGAEDDLTLVSMPFFGRFDYEVVDNLSLFGRTGIGFTYADFEKSIQTGLGRIKIDEDDTGFLFMIGWGAGYSFTEALSVESIMQFNVTTNDLFEDDFYYSWQVAALRYRF